MLFTILLFIGPRDSAILVSRWLIIFVGASATHPLKRRVIGGRSSGNSRIGRGRGEARSAYERIGSQWKWMRRQTTVIDSGRYERLQKEKTRCEMGERALRIAFRLDLPRVLELKSL